MPHASCAQARQLCAGDMISKTTYKLADALAPNFARSSKWNKEVFLAWSERILTNQEKPPGFLMVPLPDNKQTTFNYYSDEEGKLLTHLRSLYATECLRRMSRVPHDKKHLTHEKLSHL